MSYSLAQYETDTLDRNLSLWDEAPTPDESYFHRKLRVMRERKKRLREAKRMDEIYMEQGEE